MTTHDALLWLGSLSGPPALLVSLWRLAKEVQDFRRTTAEIDNVRAETKSLSDRLSPDIIKTLTEAAKLSQEREGLQKKLPLEIAKLDEEITKLRAESSQIKAAAISQTILANSAKLNCERIVRCIDTIEESAKRIHLGAEQAYGVFRKPNLTSGEIKAAHRSIVEFINESKDRGPLERVVSELEGLLEPFRNTVVDQLVPTVWEFLGEVSFSYQHNFADMIAQDDFEPSPEKCETIELWLKSVRARYHGVEKVLGLVAAQVDIRARSIESDT